MRKVIFIMLLACVTGFAYAQSTADSSTTDKKNEFMVGLKTLHAKSNVPGGILYRRNFKNISLRIGVNGTYNYRNNNTLSERNESYMIAPSIGLQRNYKLNNYFDLYWGADAVYAYHYNTNENATFTNTISNNSFGVSPFFGIRYKYKRLVLGIETSGLFSYDDQTQKQTSSDPLQIPQNWNRQSMNFTPINATKFFVGIRF